MTTIYTLTCPVCGEPPVMALDPTQAFCGNDDCPSFCWNMTMTKQENLDKVTFHDLSKLFVNGDQV